MRKYKDNEYSGDNVVYDYYFLCQKLKEFGDPHSLLQFKAPIFLMILSVLFLVVFFICFFSSAKGVLLISSFLLFFGLLIASIIVSGINVYNKRRFTNEVNRMKDIEAFLINYFATRKIEYNDVKHNNPVQSTESVNCESDGSNSTLNIIASINSEELDHLINRIESDYKQLDEKLNRNAFIKYSTIILTSVLSFSKDLFSVISWLLFSYYSNNQQIIKQTDIYKELHKIKTLRTIILSLDKVEAEPMKSLIAFISSLGGLVILYFILCFILDGSSLIDIPDGYYCINLKLCSYALHKIKYDKAKYENEIDKAEEQKTQSLFYEKAKENLNLNRNRFSSSSKDEETYTYGITDLQIDQTNIIKEIETGIGKQNRMIKELTCLLSQLNNKIININDEQNPHSKKK